MRLFIHDPNQTRTKVLIPGLRRLGMKAEMLERGAILNGLSGLDAVAAHALPVLIGAGSDRDLVEDVRLFRESGCENPALFLVNDDIPDLVSRILDAGGDDVIGPPYDPRVVAARLRAAIRQKNNRRRSSVEIGELIVHLDGRNPEAGGLEIRLSNRENEILRILALNREHTTPRRAIFDALYALSDYQPYERAIDMHISHIRKKLAATTDHGGAYIETLPKRGYRLIDPA